MKNFTFEKCNVNVIKDGDEIWFKGRDVALALGYKHPLNAVKKHVEEDERKKVLENLNPQNGDLGQNRNYVYINESGLYSLIFSSKMKKAKQFKRWVTHEVLPSIRKTGGYQLPLAKGNQLTILNEKDLHYQVVKYIYEYHPSAIIIPGLGEYQDTSWKRVDGYKKGYRGGQPDILILNQTSSENGLAIELKTPTLKGKLSDNQRNFLNKLSKLGYKTIVSCNFVEILKTIDDYFRNIPINCPNCPKIFKTTNTLATHQKHFHRVTTKHS